MTLNASINLTMTATLTDAVASYNLGGSPIYKTLSNGTDVDQADLAYNKRITIADDATPTTLDLSGGGLTDPSGNALSFAEVVAVLIINRSDSHSVTAGGGTNAVTWLAGVTLPPGGVLTLHCPSNPAFSVNSGTGDLIQLATSTGGTSVPVDILIIGRSA